MSAPKLTRIVAPQGPRDFSVSHALHNRPSYWPAYGAGVAEAMRSIGVPVESPRAALSKFIVEWHFEDGACVTTGFCYADHGPAPTWSDVDALFAMRFHPSRLNASSFPYPVFPAGFPLAAGHFAAVEPARPVPNNPDGNLFHNEQHFRTLRPVGPGDYPNRRRFRQWFLEEYGPMPPVVPQAAWPRAAARFRFVLNLCGNGNSIDRKVVVYCAMGAVIVSDRGLESLALPSGGRFIDGRNVLFVDEPEDAPRVIAGITDEKWVETSQAARRLYERSLSTSACGKWYATVAKTLVKMGVAR